MTPEHSLWSSVAETLIYDFKEEIKKSPLEDDVNLVVEKYCNRLTSERVKWVFSSIDIHTDHIDKWFRKEGMSKIKEIKTQTRHLQMSSYRGQYAVAVPPEEDVLPVSDLKK